MNNPTILFISRAYGETGGGMERLSYDLIQEFKKDSNLSVKTLTHEPPPNSSLKKTRLIGTIKALTLIPQALNAAKDADIVHLGDPLLALAGWLIKTIYKIPVIVTVHGLDVSYSSPIYRLYLHLFFRQLDGYIPISRHAEQLLKTWNPTGKVRIIAPGIHDRHYQQKASRQALERLIGQTIYHKSVLVTVGRLVPRKGHAWFIEHVVTQLPHDFLYAIIGTGPEENHLSQLIKKLNLQKKVLLLGRLKEKDLTTVYNTADAFIQPNIPIEGDAEGFGLVLLEAALCERLVLAANLDGISQAIHHHKNGFLLESQNPDEWIKTIKDQVTPETTSPDARTYTLQTFSWPKVKDEYLAFIQEYL